MKDRILILLTCFFAWQALTGQEVLSLEQAIRIGLESDFGIRILKNQELIAENNNSPGNAGFLPSVGVDGNLNYQRNNTNQEFINGETSVRNGANSTRADLGAGVEWTAFDGFRMFARRDRFELLENKAREETKAAMQSLVAEIQLGYMELIRVRSLQQIELHALDLHRDTRTLASGRLGLGAGTRLAFLQADQQVREDSIRLVELVSTEEQAKIVFNRLIGRDPTIEFEVDTTFRFPEILSKEELMQRISENNYDIRLLSMDIDAAILEQKEIKADLYPSLDLNAGYAYLYQNSDAGFLLSNRTHGPYAGVTLTYDIFTGRNIRKDLHSADLVIDNLNLDLESRKQDLVTLAEGRYARYLTYKNLEQLELEALDIAIENTELAREMYRLGRLTDLELREAIFQEIQNRDRVIEARHQMEIQAIQLMQLTGNSLGWIEN